MEIMLSFLGGALVAAFVYIVIKIKREQQSRDWRVEQRKFERQLEIQSKKAFLQYVEDMEKNYPGVLQFCGFSEIVEGPSPDRNKFF